MSSIPILTAKGAPEPGQQERIGEELSDKVVREAQDAQRELYHGLSGSGSRSPPIRSTPSAKLVSESGDNQGIAVYEPLQEYEGLGRGVLEHRLAVAERSLKIAQERTGRSGELLEDLSLRLHSIQGLTGLTPERVGEEYSGLVMQAASLLAITGETIERHLSPEEKERLQTAKKQLSGRYTPNAMQAVREVYSAIVSAFSELEKNSTTDALTGLLNRRAFDQDLTRTVSSRTGGSLLVVYMDLDGFKEINDKLGHHAGDNVLRYVASSLRLEFKRRGDALYRIGGDEFAAILSDVKDISSGAIKVERARKAITEGFIPLVGKNGDCEIYHIGISAGVAGYVRPDSVPINRDNLSQIPSGALGKVADNALYAVKGNGKNGTAYVVVPQAEKFSLEQVGSSICPYNFLGPVASRVVAQVVTPRLVEYNK